MKKNLLTHPLGLALLVAIITGTAYYLGYASGNAASPAGPDEVNLQTAQRYFDNYMRNAPVDFNGTVKALMVDMQQYDAMQQIKNSNTGLAGFRIYYGIDDNNRFVRIVAGVDGDGQDRSSSLMSTSTWMSGICPPICDRSGNSVAD